MIWYVIVAFRMFLECVCICLCLDRSLAYYVYIIFKYVSGIYSVYESCMNDINARNFTSQVEIQIRYNCRYSLYNLTRF